MENIKQASGWDVCGNALYAFGALGLEILIMMMEEGVYGMPSFEWTSIQHQIHWSVVILVWGGIACALYRQRPYAHQGSMSKMEKGIACLLALLVIGYTTSIWNGVKPWIEFQELGIVNFMFQYVYYAMEASLLVLILMFGQAAASIWLRKESKVPYGGILLALTWGLVHILTQGFATGIYTCILSLLYGCFFLVVHQRPTLAYLGIAVMFML